MKLSYQTKYTLAKRQKYQEIKVQNYILKSSFRHYNGLIHHKKLKEIKINNLNAHFFLFKSSNNVAHDQSCAKQPSAVFSFAELISDENPTAPFS